MRVRRGWVGRVAWVLALASAPGLAAVEPPKTFDVAAIDAYVQAYARERGLPGLSVAIARDGKVEMARGYGRASLAAGGAVTEETRFAIGSVTKQFTCACILLLAEDGRLSIDDPVAKYYPDLARAGDIRILDLMQHVSGYPDYYPLDFVDRRMQRPIDPDDLLRAYAAGPLDFEPGERWSYSNTGYILLGRIVEKASGEPFGTFLRRRILEPLGLGRIAFEPPSPGDGLASGHTTFGLGPWEPAMPEARGWLGAAGGLWATAADLARWDLALMEGRVLRPQSLARMTAPRRLREGLGTAYGCGLFVSEPEGVTVLEHDGSVSGFMASNTMLPVNRSALVLLTNSEDGRGLGAMQDALLPLLKPEKPIPKVAGPPAAEAARALFLEYRTGQVDRGRLAPEFDAFLTPEKLRAASTHLRPLGAPREVELLRLSERGGTETARLRIVCRKGVVRALLRRSPDGKVEEFLLERE